jgi:hypothetical protein
VDVRERREEIAERFVVDGLQRASRKERPQNRVDVRDLALHGVYHAEQARPGERQGIGRTDLLLDDLYRQRSIPLE